MSQLIVTVSDGIARHTPEGSAWRDLAMREGFAVEFVARS